MRVWGGMAWKRMVDAALERMGDLTGKSVLELGFHDGEMSREFARRGATVTALEVDSRCFPSAPHVPPSNVTYLLYDGNLDGIDGAYDFVFTKSVLVLTDLEQTLLAIRRKLKPGGMAVFIENGTGPAALSWLRYLMKPRSVWGNVRYFDADTVTFIRSHFAECEVRSALIPPVYLLIGHTATPSSPARAACAS